jgi:glycosyltransferase involved in cell wall biosynthesis
LGVSFNKYTKPRSEGTTVILKIAITADPQIPVPPVFYGGIERIIDMLIAGFKNLGHEVTIFAHKDSKINCRLIPYKATGNSLKDTLANTLTINSILLKEKFDVIQSFGRLAYLFPQMPLGIPKIMSYQREPTISQVVKAVKLSRNGSLVFTGCSNHITNKIKPYAIVQTIFNGVDLAKYRYSDTVQHDAPLVFLGRIEPIKGTHIAIEIAKKTNRNLVIAGNIPIREQQYCDDHIKPFLNDKIIYMGPVSDEQKNELLNKALAMLMPIQWDEPFGIVMIEAMACGTPVIGFKRGAVTEVIQEGVTGFYGDVVDELIQAVDSINLLNRKQIRSITQERFSAEVITSQYIELYQQMTGKK